MFESALQGGSLVPEAIASGIPEEAAVHFAWPPEGEIEQEWFRISEVREIDPETLEEDRVIPKSGDASLAANRSILLNQVRHARIWLGEVLQEEWIPDDIEDLLIARCQDRAGLDLFAMRYKKKDVIVQVIQPFHKITVLIVPGPSLGPELPPPSDPKGFLRFFVHRFINKAEEIEKISLPSFHQEPFGWVAFPNLDSGIAGSDNFWWGLCALVTDGKVFMLTTAKSAGGKFNPSPREAWFRAE